MADKTTAACSLVLFAPQSPVRPSWARARIFNELPLGHIGFGSPEISTRSHNVHAGSESDGFTGDHYSSKKFGPTP
jgi:hypothetical protein